MRCLPIGQRNGHGGQSSDQDQHTQAEDRPVDSDAEAGIDWAHQANRGKGGEGYGCSSGQQRPGDHRRQDAEQPVAEGHGGASAQCPQCAEVIATQAQLAADHLAGDQQGSQGRDPSEDTQGN